MVEAIIDEKDTLINEIQIARHKIADLKKDKINLRAKSWDDATMKLADAKKDFVRSMVSDLDAEIDKLEADIEYYYNRMKVLDNRLEYE